MGDDIEKYFRGRRNCYLSCEYREECQTLGRSKKVLCVEEIALRMFQGLSKDMPRDVGTRHLMRIFRLETIDCIVDVEDGWSEKDSPREMDYLQALNLAMKRGRTKFQADKYQKFKASS